VAKRSHQDPTPHSDKQIACLFGDYTQTTLPKKKLGKFCR
jgi:hypothetical protein